ncbi:hypothetical protein [Butyrivibrio proteoclasticus]|uniref:hypothetical protein n=1 Tax=Butyrivibrio proteoclasticus TaxID=43305 RepID=UPI00047C34D1|nr:hypothetical protein [Butyrivibrio proteoclasticus]
MTKIYTTNKQGQKVAIEYEQRIIEEKQAPEEITITDYKTFRKCLEKSNEQQQYLPTYRDMRYLRALGTFHSEHPDLYKTYQDKIWEEIQESHKG